ncbi:MAG: phosphoribosylaminoimidazolesuccinocarboxamide synthase, partial [Kiritimatiellia bacterium]
MLSEERIRAELNNVLDEVDCPDLGEKISGKVRDSYRLGDKRVLVTTDRISAFDRILGTIP